jgi:ubiquitin carboxyl-terminal hydrolase 14
VPGHLFNATQAGLLDIAGSLRDLFHHMSRKQTGYAPIIFLNTLRTVYPQFAQKSKDGHGFAQQDAEEAWSQIISQLRQKLRLKDGGSNDTSSSGTAGISFIDKFMSGTFETVTECEEAAAKEAGEEPVHSETTFFKLDCHINADTNHLRDGLMSGLKEKIEKNSTFLNRSAIYIKTSRISRLPKYLPVHFLRFDWRRSTNQKAKIMRKVTFPMELDAVEFCSEGLKNALMPVRDKIRDIRKAEDDALRARKRQKRIKSGEEPAGVSKMENINPFAPQK